MKYLLVLLFVLFAVSAIAQPYVDPDMIEMSYDGVTFNDASTFVEDIQISTGAVSGNHVTHARRGALITFECQLGSTYTTEKVSWTVDTALLPSSENKIYFRIQFGVSETLEDGTMKKTLSPRSQPSDVVKLIGAPGKPVNKG